MATKHSCPNSVVKHLQKRSLDGLHFHNPGLRFFRRTISCSQSLYKRDLFGHYGCVNAIEFSAKGDLIASGGDDRRLLLWNVWRTIFDGTKPSSIDTQHLSNINSCAFDCSGKTFATGGSDGQVIVHDIAGLKTNVAFGLSDAVFCLSADPINATNIAAASDDGKVQILDTRSPLDSGLSVIADLGGSMHSVMFNPSEPRLLATANSKHGIAVWDVRKPRYVHIKSSIQNCMSVRFNSRGDQLLVLRRRGSPVLCDMTTMNPICKFDYTTYYNACTLKSASFAGLQDEFVMSGSDDFCVYLWKVPVEPMPYSYHHNTEPHMILKGHRSIVNQVRYCPYNQMIISSGVEKLIKMWTPYALPGSIGHLKHSRRYGDDDEVERNAYSHEEYIHMVLRASSFLSHDYSNGNTKEEPCMIAFFDSLIQREVEQSGEESDNSTESDREKRERDRHPSDTDENRAEPSNSESTSRALSPFTRDKQASDASDDDDDDRHDNLTVSRHGDSPRPDLESSSDSASEVDEILSAMYSRYMNSRDNASISTGPTGRKISSVIAQRKYKNKIKRHRVLKEEGPPVRSDSHVNGDFYHRDNSRNMSVLADVIDNFVDTLVGSGFSSEQSLSDTNDGGMGNTSPRISNSVGLANLSVVNPSDERGRSAASSSPSDNCNTFSGVFSHSEHSNDHRERSLYFVPELEAFPSLPSSSSSSDSDRQKMCQKSFRNKEGGTVSGKSRPFELNHHSSKHKSRTKSSVRESSSESDSPTSSRSSSSIVRSKRQRKRYPEASSSSSTNLPPTLTSSLSASDSHRGSSKKTHIKSISLTPTLKSGCDLNGGHQVSENPSPSSSSHTLPSSSSICNANTSHCRKASLMCSDSASNFTVKEKKPVFRLEDIHSDQANSASSETQTTGQVLFKKVKKSKGRRFRKHRQKDSCSSSED